MPFKKMQLKLKGNVDQDSTNLFALLSLHVAIDRLVLLLCF